MLVDHKDEEDPVALEMIPTVVDVTDHTSFGEMLYLVALATYIERQTSSSGHLFPTSSLFMKKENEVKKIRPNSVT